MAKRFTNLRPPVWCSLWLPWVLSAGSTTGAEDGEPTQQSARRNGFSGERFIGARVADSGGTHFGRVKNLLIDPYSEWVTHVIVDTGGFWEASRTNVRVPMDRLRSDSITSARYLGTDVEFDLLPGG